MLLIRRSRCTGNMVISYLNHIVSLSWGSIAIIDLFDEIFVTCFARAILRN
jgi:hypothetical protein